MDNMKRSGIPRPDSAARSMVGATLLSAAMALPLAAPVHAESAPDRGLISFKQLDYQESQPGEPRIHVNASSLAVMVPIAGEWSVGATIVSDGISGASPAYHTRGVTPMRDRRRAADTDITHYYEHGTLNVGFNFSNESDYLSRGIALKGSLSNEDRNTTWMAGIGFNSDSINPTNGVVVAESKQVTDLLAGVTQVVTSVDILQLTLGYSRGRGYFSDPYKILDNRPREKNHGTILARWNHHFKFTDGTARFSYRYYSDSWNLKAHTLGTEYVQPLANGWTVTPLFRLYSQSSAEFYVDADAVPSPFAPILPDNARYYSGDQRLSAFGAHTLGLKIAKQLDANWLVDIKFEKYEQRAAWRLFGSGSPNLAPFNARNIQFGVSRQF